MAGSAPGSRLLRTHPGAEGVVASRKILPGRLRRLTVVAGRASMRLE